MRIFLVIALALAAHARPAQAAWPEDVSLSTMSQQTTSVADAYLQLIQELAVAISAPASLPPRTLGAAGFDASMGNVLAFTTTTPTVEGDDNTSPWALAHTESDPRPTLTIPQISVRKGLPLSTEIGVRVGWLAMSRQGLISTVVRVAALEGVQPLPDATFHLGWTRYVGNPELELAVREVGFSVGTTLPLGSHPTIRQARLQPFLSTSALSITATPTLEPSIATATGIVALSAKKKDPHFDKDMRRWRHSAGLQLIAGSFLLRTSAAWHPGVITTFSSEFGFSY